MNTEIAQDTRFNYSGRTFRKTITYDGVQKFYCLDETLPDYLNQNNGFGYTNLYSFFIMLRCYQKRIRAKNRFHIRKWEHVDRNRRIR